MIGFSKRIIHEFMRIVPFALLLAFALPATALSQQRTDTLWHPVVPPYERFKQLLADDQLETPSYRTWEKLADERVATIAEDTPQQGEEKRLTCWYVYADVGEYHELRRVFYVYADDTRGVERRAGFNVFRYSLRPHSGIIQDLRQWERVLQKNGDWKLDKEQSSLDICRRHMLEETCMFDLKGDLIESCR